MHASPSRATLLVQKTLPIWRDAPCRPGHGLIHRMRMRGRQRRPFENLSGAVVVAPVFAGLEASDDRVAGLLAVLCRVLIGRGVAAADVAAFRAAAQVQPPVLRRRALNAAGTAGLGLWIDPVRLRFHDA